MAKEKAQKAKTKGWCARKSFARIFGQYWTRYGLDELRVVANNQSEWARRVRELRTEEGFLILTHNDRSELKLHFNTYLKHRSHNQPLSGQFQKKPVRMSSPQWFHLSNVRRSRGELILTTQHARHASTSGTSSTKAKAVQ